MRETLDTSSNFPDKNIPDGTYEFRVMSVVKKYGGANKDKPFYVWLLTFGDNQAEQILMPNMMGDLLRVLGCKEVKQNHFDWDTDEVMGAKFTATVTHSPDKKDSSKIRQNMTEFKKTEDIPF